MTSPGRPKREGPASPLASSPAAPVRHVRCPACGGPSLYGPDNSARPFCSERCRQHDLGAWAAEDYRVAAPPTRDDLDEDLLPSVQ